VTVSVVDNKRRVWVDPLRLFVYTDNDSASNPFFSPSLQVVRLQSRLLL
jgi:hypothetical protein